MSLTKNEKFLLFILAAIQFTHIMDFMIMMPLGPMLKALFKIDSQYFGFLVSSYNISAGISAFAAAFFVDRFDRKKVLLFAYIGFVVGTFTCALSPNYFFLLLARTATGAFGGIAGASILSVVGDAIPNERRATAMGILMAGFSVAAVLGVPLGLFLSNKISWHAPFFLIAGIGVILTLLIIKQIPSMTGHIKSVVAGNKPSPFRVITDIAKDKNQLRALLLTIMIMCGHFSIIPFLSDYFVHNVGLTNEQLPLIYFIGGTITIFSSPLSGRLSDKYGRFKVLTFLSLLALFPLFILTNMPPTGIINVLLVTSLFFLASGRMIPANAMITSTVLPQQRGGFMSINSSVQQLASGIISFVSGMIIVNTPTGELRNYNYVGYIAIIGSLLAIVVASKIKMVDAARAKI